MTGDRMHYQRCGSTGCARCRRIDAGAARQGRMVRVMAMALLAAGVAAAALACALHFFC